MSRGRRRPKFTLVEIDAFDASYQRCSIPGVAYKPEYDRSMPFRPSTIVADFWRDRSGNLVAVPEQDMEDFAEYASAVFYDWAGTDESPDPDFQF